MTEKEKELILKCFCESRRTQAFYSNCLTEDISEEGREFLLELVQETAKTSNKIKDYCMEVYRRNNE
ncbi:hypothetical protein [Ureibacillus sp. FSL K6-3587]|uniref:hypothetical protein n=1 Tax=Ureibacillus sp. FSL K6-3587 TaxID=2954681 RepID=UPI0031588662